MANCDPRDIAIKSLFLGPQSENGEWLKAQWTTVLDHWLKWRQTRFPLDGPAISNQDQQATEFQNRRRSMESGLKQILKQLEDETPKFTPRYLGHMISEVSLPALLGHVCAVLHNPNNTSRDVSKVTSQLEDEAIRDLATMVGFGSDAQGHFTGGGTLANLEGLWRAIIRLDHGLSLFLALNSQNKTPDFLDCAMGAVDSRSIPIEDIRMFSPLRTGPWRWMRLCQKAGVDFSGPVILVPASKHYSWEKGAALLGLGDDSLWQVPLDRHGRMDTEELYKSIKRAVQNGHPVALVVSIAGTTELGQIDAIDRVQDLLDQIRREHGWKIPHHVDAAYGGYFCSTVRDDTKPEQLRDETVQALGAMKRADSITLDPHKLGYIPYACGAFLTRESDYYFARSPAAPYLKADIGSRWNSTIEGSRSGTGAAATWLSNRVIGLDGQGYGRLLRKGLEARDALTSALKNGATDALIIEPSDLNVVCFCFASPGEKLSAVNRRSQLILQAMDRSADFSISRTSLSIKNYSRLILELASRRGIIVDEDHWVQLRLVLMNPFLTSQESKVSYINDLVAALRAAF